MTRRVGRAIGLWLLVAGLAAGGSASAAQARFLGEPASEAARRVADWVVASADNGPLPFLVVDKVEAKVFVFEAGGQLRGASPVLLGLATGDNSVPGIGERKLATITPEERTTPAGRFVAGLGEDLTGAEIVWVDYDAAVSMHRVVTGNKKEQRLQRLATPTPLDNRISYGCINVPLRFYDAVVHPTFATSSAIVYVLPERKALTEVFPKLAAETPADR